MLPRGENQSFENAVLVQNDQHHAVIIAFAGYTLERAFGTGGSTAAKYR
jgi:hypothetical protein